MRSSPGRAVKGSDALAASQEAWPDAEPLGRKSLGREPRVERRQASAPCKARAAPLGAEDKDQRLPAFRFLSAFPASERKKPKSPERRESDMRGAKKFANLQRRQKIAPRERIFISSFRGAAEGREPGIHSHRRSRSIRGDSSARSAVMDSGLAAEPVIGPATSGRTRWRRPGMTTPLPLTPPSPRTRGEGVAVRREKEFYFVIARTTWRNRPVAIVTLNPAMLDLQGDCHLQRHCCQGENQ